MLDLRELPGLAQHTVEHEPEIALMPSRAMAVVHTVGEPERVMHLVLPALYSSVYRLKSDLRASGIDFPAGHVRVRWPDADYLAPSLRHGIWGLPIPEGCVQLPQQYSHIEVERETWEYGQVAQIVHRGPTSEEGSDLACLKEYIAEKGYEVVGPLEEEYLSGPEPAIRKTLLRYRVRRAP